MLAVAWRWFAENAQSRCRTRSDADGLGVTDFGFLWFVEKRGDWKQGETAGKQIFKSVWNGGMADRDPVPLPAEVRAKLAELELELSEGEYLGFTAELGGSAGALLLLLLWDCLSLLSLNC